MSTHTLALSSAGAASALGVSTKTLANWRVSGLGPRPTRLGQNRVLYRVDDLDRWLDAVQKAGSVKAAHAGGDA